MAEVIDYAKEDIHYVLGDTFDISFSVKKNGVNYAMTGMSLNFVAYTMNIAKTVIASASSALGTILITSNVFNINLPALTVEEGKQYLYNIYLTNTEGVFTIQKGSIITEEGKK